MLQTLSGVGSAHELSHAISGYKGISIQEFLE
jgi:hypothetical protein